MADTKRIIIGSEANDDRKITLDELGSKIALPVSIYNSSGSIIDTFTTTISGSVTVTATDLDIRNLTSSDVVTVTGGLGQVADVKVSLDGEAVVLGAGSASIGTVDTELPAAVALAENTANPTVPGVGAFLMAADSAGTWDRVRILVPNSDDIGEGLASSEALITAGFNYVYDGTAWDRARGDSTDGLLVNLGSNNDVVVTGNVAAGSADSGNPVKVGGIYHAGKPTLLNLQRGDIELTERGAQLVSIIAHDLTTALSFEVDNADNVAASGTSNNMSTISRLTLFDGTAWDRARGDSTDGLLVNLGSNNDVTVSQDSQGSLDHGSNLDIDLTAEQITATSFSAKRGVLLKCPLSNTGIVYVGNSDVTAGTTAATDGIPLEAGESLFMEVNNPNLLYAIADTANQKIFWMAT